MTGVRKWLEQPMESKLGQEKRRHNEHDGQQRGLVSLSGPEVLIVVPKLSELEKLKGMSGEEKQQWWRTGCLNLKPKLWIKCKIG